MSAREKWWLGAVLFATTCASSVSGQVIWWNQSVVDDMGMIADTAHVEHYRCLLGAWHNDTLYIVAAYQPQIIAATALFVSTGPCPPLITLGEFHNHVPRTITAMGEDRGQTMPIEAYCELSSIDRRIRPDSPLLQVIAVNRAISCAWVLEGNQYVRMVNWPPTRGP